MQKFNFFLEEVELLLISPSPILPVSAAPHSPRPRSFWYNHPIIHSS
jgi:hypothetical protein